MKRIPLLLLFLAFATSAFASSLNIFVPNQSTYGYTESWGGYSYSGIYSSSAANSLGGLQYTWMDVYNNGSSSMTNFQSGYVETEFASRTGGWLDTWGNLSNIKFNPLTDVLTAAFSGYAEKYNPTNYTWGYVYFTGFFTDKLPVTGTTWSYNDGYYSETETYGNGPGHITITGLPAGYTPQDVGGATAVPEPASLVMLGTGLVGIAGVVRRKLKV